MILAGAFGPKLQYNHGQYRLDHLRPLARGFESIEAMTVVV